MLLSLTLKENTISNLFLYTCTYCRNTYQQGSKLLQTKNFENRELNSHVLLVKCGHDWVKPN